MKKLKLYLFLFGLFLPVALPAAFPTHSNSATVDCAYVSGDWDSFKWTWAGKNSQTVSFYVKDSGTWLNLTPYNLAFKMARIGDSGQVTYISLVPTNITVSGSNVTFSIPYTNVPPNRAYVGELFTYEGAASNATRTLAQGSMVVFNSLYADNDSTFPWPGAVTNLIDYLTKLEAAITYASITNQAASVFRSSPTNTGSVGYLLARGATATQTYWTAASGFGDMFASIYDPAGVAMGVVFTNDARLTDSRNPLAHNQAWSTITATPTTISGYGLTDAVATNDARLTDARAPLAHNQNWSTITGTPTSVSGYGITNSIIYEGDIRLTDARTPTAHNQAWGTITSTPTTVAGYGITDAATGTPVYAESDPIWAGSSNSVLSHVVSDSVTSNSGNWAGTWQGLGTNAFYPASNPSSFVDRAGATNGMQVAGNYATGTPVYVESDPTASSNLTVHVNATGTSVHGLGTASTNNSGDFATAAQGTNAAAHIAAAGTAVHGLGTAATHSTNDFFQQNVDNSLGLSGSGVMGNSSTGGTATLHIRADGADEGSCILMYGANCFSPPFDGLNGALILSAKGNGTTNIIIITSSNFSFYGKSLINLADPVDPTDGVNYRTARNWLIVTNAPSFLTNEPSWQAVSGLVVYAANATYTTTVALASGAYPSSNPSNFVDASITNALASTNWVMGRGFLTNEPSWLAASGTVVYTTTPTYTSAVAKANSALQAGAVGTWTNLSEYNNDLAGLSTNLSDFNNDVGYLTNEPSWLAASNIVSGNAANGQTAYGWGNHNTGGYFKADGSMSPETDQNFDSDGWAGETNYGNYVVDDWTLNDSWAKTNTTTWPAYSLTRAAWLPSNTGLSPGTYTNSYLESPLMTNGIGILSFQCYNKGASNLEVKVWISTNGTDWTVAETFTNINRDVYNLHSVKLNVSGDCYFRISKTSSGSSLYYVGLDDIQANYFDIGYRKLVNLNDPVEPGDGCNYRTARNWLIVTNAPSFLTNEPSWLAASNIVSGNAANGQTAYGWGNPATNGYIKGVVVATTAGTSNNLTVSGNTNLAFTFNTNVATMAQGAKADSAIQVVVVTTSLGSSNNLTVTGGTNFVLTINTNIATHAQGATADAALPKSSTNSLIVVEMVLPVNGQIRFNTTTNYIGDQGGTNFLFKCGTNAANFNW